MFFWASRHLDGYNIVASGRTSVKGLKKENAFTESHAAGGAGRETRHVLNIQHSQTTSHSDLAIPILTQWRKKR
jgi:hypothetical protein